MGTTHNFDVPAASTLGETDRYASLNGSTSRGAYVTGAQLRSFAGGGLVSTTATTLSVTATQHAGRTVRLATAAPVVVTLPATTGSGDVYTFFVAVAATATESTIKVTSTDVMKGVVWAATTSSDNAESFVTTATSDSIELNGTTKGGVVGDL